MNLVNNIRHFVLDDELLINVFKDKVNIINYERIGQFDSNKVVVHHEEGSVVIMGDHLIISRLMSNEVLVVGNIKTVELR